MSLKQSWPTIIEDKPKASFSVVTTLKHRGSYNSFAWIASLILDPYFIRLSVRQGGIKYSFLSLWYHSTRDQNSKKPKRKEVSKLFNKIE